MLSEILETSKKAYEVMFSEILFNTIYAEIKKHVKKTFFRQNKRYKKCTLFSFAISQIITVLLLIHDSYMS